MFSSSSWFVHLQNKQKQTFASDNYHVGTTAENLIRLTKKKLQRILQLNCCPCNNKYSTDSAKYFAVISAINNINHSHDHKANCNTISGVYGYNRLFINTTHHCLINDIKSRNLRIRNFRSNRISNRIGGYDWNSNRTSN